MPLTITQIEVAGALHRELTPWATTDRALRLLAEPPRPRQLGEFGGQRPLCRIKLRLGARIGNTARIELTSRMLGRGEGRCTARHRGDVNVVFRRSGPEGRQERPDEVALMIHSAAITGPDERHDAHRSPD